MSDLILSFNVVLPLVLMMALGYGLKVTGYLDKSTLKKMNSIIFKFLLPCSIFYNVYISEIDTILNPRFIRFCLISVISIFIVSSVVVCFLEKTFTKRGALIQGIFRSNFLIYGLPVSTALFGDEAASLTSITIAIIVPVFNFLAVIVLEYFRGGKPDLKKIIKNIITNPLIVGSVIGLLFLLFKFKLPAAFETAIKDVGKTATPLALILLGATIDLQVVKDNIRELVIGITGKLIIAPVLVILAAILLGFSPIELSVLIAAFASPTAVSSMTMAQEMDSDYELAAQIVMFTTILSVFTVFFFIFALKSLNYF